MTLICGPQAALAEEDIRQWDRRFTGRGEGPAGSLAGSDSGADGATGS